MAENIVTYLFPGWKAGEVLWTKSPQSIRIGPFTGPPLLPQADDVDYWQRIIAEEIRGLRDQGVVRAVIRWKDKRTPSKLFKKLASSNQYGQRFERIIQASDDPAHPLYLSDAELYELAGDFHRHSVLCNGVAAELRQAPEGYYAIWRRLLGRNLGDSHAEWVVSEIDAFLNKSLRLTMDIEYWWTNAKEHPNWQESACRHIYQEVKMRIIQTGGEWLATVLDPMYLWTLHHLIRHQYEHALFAASDWSWVEPHLRHLMRFDPRFIPHVACLISKTVEMRNRDQNGRPTRERLWILDKNYLDEFIPDAQERKAFAAELLHPYDFPALEMEDVIRVRHLQGDIGNYLSRSNAH